MTGGSSATAAGGVVRMLVMAAGLLGLAACATEPVDDGAGRTIEMPLQWQDIDLAEADVTLPLTTPVEIATLGKRIGEGQVFENLYTFHGLKGYVLTSRIVFGHYTGQVSKRLRSGGAFKLFAEELSLPPGGTMRVLQAQPFTSGDARTQGYFGRAAARPYHDRCFVARVGYLLVEYASVEREADSVDTIVEVLLCGSLPSDAALVEMLQQVKAVEDRAAFRRELAKRPIGTI